MAMQRTFSLPTWTVIKETLVEDRASVAVPQSTMDELGTPTPAKKRKTTAEGSSSQTPVPKPAKRPKDASVNGPTVTSHVSRNLTNRSSMSSINVGRFSQQVNAVAGPSSQARNVSASSQPVTPTRISSRVSRPTQKKAAMIGDVTSDSDRTPPPGIIPRLNSESRKRKHSETKSPKADKTVGTKGKVEKRHLTKPKPIPTEVLEIEDSDDEPPKRPKKRPKVQEVHGYLNLCSDDEPSPPIIRIKPSQTKKTTTATSPSKLATAKLLFAERLHKDKSKATAASQSKTTGNSQEVIVIDDSDDEPSSKAPRRSKPKPKSTPSTPLKPKAVAKVVPVQPPAKVIDRARAVKRAGAPNPLPSPSPPLTFQSVPLANPKDSSLQPPRERLFLPEPRSVPDVEIIEFDATEPMHVNHDPATPRPSAAAEAPADALDMHVLQDALLSGAGDLHATPPPSSPTPLSTPTVTDLHETPPDTPDIPQARAEVTIKQAVIVKTPSPAIRSPTPIPTSAQTQDEAQPNLLPPSPTTEVTEIQVDKPAAQLVETNVTQEFVNGLLKESGIALHASAGPSQSPGARNDDDILLISTRSPFLSTPQSQRRHKIVYSDVPPERPRMMLTTRFFERAIESVRTFMSHAEEKKRKEDAARHRVKEEEERNRELAKAKAEASPSFSAKLAVPSLSPVKVSSQWLVQTLSQLGVPKKSPSQVIGVPGSSTSLAPPPTSTLSSAATSSDAAVTSTHPETHVPRTSALVSVTQIPQPLTGNESFSSALPSSPAIPVPSTSSLPSLAPAPPLMDTTAIVAPNMAAASSSAADTSNPQPTTRIVSIPESATSEPEDLVGKEVDVDMMMVEPDIVIRPNETPEDGKVAKAEDFHQEASGLPATGLIADETVLPTAKVEPPLAEEEEETSDEERVSQLILLGPEPELAGRTSSMAVDILDVDITMDEPNPQEDPSNSFVRAGTAGGDAVGSTPPLAISRTSSSASYSSQKRRDSVPLRSNLDVFFIHPPFDTFPDTGFHPHGLTYRLLSENPDWFLDPQDFLADGMTYPSHLEPPSKTDIRVHGWPTDKEPRFRCTFCRLDYAGPRARDHWRRHVSKKHNVAWSTHTGPANQEVNIVEPEPKVVLSTSSVNSAVFEDPVTPASAPSTIQVQKQGDEMQYSAIVDETINEIRSENATPTPSATPAAVVISQSAPAELKLEPTMLIDVISNGEDDDPRLSSLSSPIVDPPTRTSSEISTASATTDNSASEDSIRLATPPSEAPAKMRPHIYGIDPTIYGLPQDLHLLLGDCLQEVGTNGADEDDDDWFFSTELAYPDQVTS